MILNRFHLQPMRPKNQFVNMKQEREKIPLRVKVKETYSRGGISSVIMCNIRSRSSNARKREWQKKCSKHSLSHCVSLANKNIFYRGMQNNTERGTKNCLPTNLWHLNNRL